ncbi:glycosyl transferase [Arthrobacter sp. Soil782]|uniref:glycosyltransferase n=1 Tax=Arthrobacter sp. Soil782 TaxID=1736410 RepID=UPI0006FAD1A6|nr:nucleotide disphospho-sugar-binding domain-containing protein [Arthrobacter sp. Soil782]KRF05306.1 glycosyl transferase [Arthrobacter sp. Soil782]
MASVLVCSCSVTGHVVPMLAVAAGLVNRGHSVRFLTGQRFAERVAATGATFLPLPPETDFDETNQDEEFPGKAGLKGPTGIRYDLTNIFMRPGKHQYDAVQAAIAETPTDAVLSEALFMGVALLLNTPRAQRPTVINCGIVPLSLASRDTAPFGLGIPPMRGPIGRFRNRALKGVTEQVIFAPVQKYADQVACDATGKPFPGFFMNWPRHADILVQFGVPEFEYPRSDLPDHVHFVGPVSQSGGRDTADIVLPEWWGDLDSGRPVVHVTQGTVANRDYDDLIRPTIDGLANDDVFVVVSTGGRPEDTLPGPLPANVRVSSYLPYDELLPKTSVVVTNGGYGGVQFALRHGVPLVVAGQSEEKAEVTARVAWSGTGINLRTKGAKPDDVAKAVRKVLAEPSYRQHAQRIGKAIKESRGVDALVDLVEASSTVT